MAINETANVTLSINGEDAKRKLEDLKKQASNLSEAIKKAYQAGDATTAKKLTTEFRKTQAEITKTQKSTENLNVAMQSLSTATPKQLRAILADINKELNSGAVKRGSAEWNDYQKKIGAVRSELEKISAEQKEAAKMSTSFADKFNRIKGVAVGVAAAVTGVGVAIKGMSDYAKAKDSARAGVKALTGLDDESVAWLQAQAEQMSQAMDESGLRVTQSADQILEAYKLVGSAKPELLAVKEDLNKVTIEAIRLSQAAGMELTDAVSAVTVSMNQFGAGADRTAEFVNVLAAGSKVGAVGVENINEAVLKSGVAANNAGLSIQELVGAIETIGERGLQGSEAGTALKSFFLTLSSGADETNPKVVGVSQALKNLAAQNLSDAEMVQKFGKNAFNVASILVDSTDAFDKYTEAVTGTNTAVEQAAIMGDTLAAKQAQMKNQLAELGQTIYTALQPAIEGFLDKTTSIVKVIGTLLTATREHLGAIVAIVAPLVAYNAALAITNALHSKGVTAVVNYTKSLFSMATIEKATTAAKYLLATATALLTGNFKKATVAFKAFSKTLALNPIGLIATAIAAVVVGLVAWTRREKELTKAEKERQAIAEMNADIEKKVNDETATEISRIEKLKAVIHNKNLSEKTRLKAIQELKGILPGYNAELTKEGEIINENTKAIDDYIAAIKERAKAKVIESQLTDLVSQRMTAEQRRDSLMASTEQIKEARDEWNEYVQRTADRNNWSFDDAENWLQRTGAYKNSNLSQAAKDYAKKPILGGLDKEAKQNAKELAKLNEQIDILLAKEKELTDWIGQKEQAKTIQTATIEEETPEGTGDADKDARKKKLEELEQTAERERLAIDKAFAEGKTTYAQHATDLLNVDKWLIDSQQKLFNKSEKEWVTYENKRLKLNQDFIKLNDDLLQREETDELHELQARYSRGAMYLTDYEAQKTEIELQTLKRRRDLWAQNSKEFADLDWAVKQKEIELQKQQTAISIKEIEDRNNQLNQLLALRLARGEMSEQAYNEAVYQAEIHYLQEVRDKYSEFSDDYIAISKKIETAQAQHAQQLAKAYTDALAEFNNTYTTKGANAEYQSGIAQIDSFVANGDVSAEDADRAKTALGQKLLEAELKHAGETNSSIVDTYRARYTAIEQLEQKGIINHEQAEKAKLSATTEMLSSLEQIYQSAWGSIDSILQASSNLINANAELETNTIEKEYERRIDAAGRNHRKVEKLEEERDAKIAEIKTKANEKQMKIELAQAIAGTAMSAINAYSSASAIPVAGWVLGPIAAAAALAAGAIQIASIKKQHQAESAGYAKGGFTPNGRWDQEQGVVHSNEFVANRYAVGNPEILPALQLIDRAQKANTVQNLTAADVSASLRTTTSPDVVSAVNSQSAVATMQQESANNNIALMETAKAVQQTASAVERLNEQLDNGITAIASISGRNGIDEQTKKYNRLINNAR